MAFPVFLGRLAAVLGTAGLLAGCAAIPHDRPASKPVEGAALGLAGDPALAVAPDWWRALGDPQLDRIMADALAQSPTLATAAARLRSAAAEVAGNRAGLGPQASADADETYQRLSGRYIIPPPYAGTRRWVGTAQANLSWSLDLAGRQRALIDQARASAEAVTLDLAAARVTLAGAVAQAYVDLARAEAQAAIARDFVASRQEGLRLANTRRRNQLASDFDLRAAETLLAEAQQAAVRADGARATATHALAALAGRGIDYAAAIGPARIAPATALPLPQSLPIDLLGRRPDILAARARIEAADAARRVARADFYPSVDLKAFVGLSAIGLGSLLTSNAGTYGAGPAVHLPIFKGGRLAAGYQGAVAAGDVAIGQYNDLVVRSVREAADALTAVGTNAADAARQREIVHGLSETVRLDQIRVETGLGARLDVLDAGDRLLAARQTAADLDADGAVARVRLLVALGGGFTPVSQDIAAASPAAGMRR